MTEWQTSIDDMREPGWYAVAVGWDVQEGVFPYVLYWTGDAWRSGKPGGMIVKISSNAFKTEIAATEWVRKNDPEFGAGNGA